MIKAAAAVDKPSTARVSTPPEAATALRTVKGSAPSKAKAAKSSAAAAAAVRLEPATAVGAAAAADAAPPPLSSHDTSSITDVASMRLALAGALQGFLPAVRRVRGVVGVSRDMWSRIRCSEC